LVQDPPKTKCVWGACENASVARTWLKKKKGKGGRSVGGVPSGGGGWDSEKKK